MRSVLPTAAPPAPRALSPLPQATLPTLPHDGSPVYSMGRVDPAGRIFDRVLTDTLAWHPGTPVIFSTTTGLIVIRRDPAGTGAVAARSSLTIPAVLRAHCGLVRGSRALLATLPGHDLLIVYPQPVLHAMIVSHHSALERGSRLPRASGCGSPVNAVTAAATSDSVALT